MDHGSGWKSVTAFAVMSGVVFAGACAPGDGSPGVTVVDSAGIRVVTYADSATPAFTVSPTPELVVGAKEDPEDQLYQVRGGFLAPDGSVVLANAGTQEIRYYDRDGRMVRAVGRDGDGPGEFRAIAWIHPWPDGSLTVYDARARRMTVVSPAGEVTSVARADLGRPEEGFDIIFPNSLMDVLPNGGAMAILRSGIKLEHAPGVREVRGELAVLDSDLGEQTTLGSVLTLVYYELPDAERFPVAAVPGTSVAKFSGNGSMFAFTDGARHRVRVFDAGRPTVIMEEERARVVARPPVEPGDVPAADSLPAYSDLKVDGLGRVWVRPGSPEEATVAEWVVFSGRDGSRLGRMVLPASAQVLDATGSQVLILLRDEFDVERVEIRTWHGG